jgi:hypothetical protein
MGYLYHGYVSHNQRVYLDPIPKIHPFLGLETASKVARLCSLPSPSHTGAQRSLSAAPPLFNGKKRGKHQKSVRNDGKMMGNP